MSKKERLLFLIGNKKYALKKQIELTFGHVATSVFMRYRERVDKEFSELSKETLLKLQAIEGKL